MTEHEKLRNTQIKSVRRFLQDNRMDAWMLAKIEKELCCCGTCGFFVQHYSKDGTTLDWGHCCKGNIQHSKKTSTASCGFWTMAPKYYRIDLVLGAEGEVSEKEYKRKIK